MKISEFNPKFILLALSLATLCAVTWSCAEIGCCIPICGFGCLLVNEIAGVVSNAIAMFVTVISIVSIATLKIEGWEDKDNQRKAMDPPLMATDSPIDIFVDKPTNRGEEGFFEQIQSCLEKVSCLGNIPAPDQFYLALRHKLQTCNVIITIHYDDVPVDWITQRINLYKKLSIYKKVIIYTNNKNHLNNNNIIVLPLQKINCQELKNKIAEIKNLAK